MWICSFLGLNKKIAYSIFMQWPAKYPLLYYKMGCL